MPVPVEMTAVIDCGLFHCFSDDDRRRYVRGLARVMERRDIHKNVLLTRR